MAATWPDSIRQLQNVVRNLVVRHDGGRATAAMLPPEFSRAVGGRTAPGIAAPASGAPPAGGLPATDQPDDPWRSAGAGADDPLAAIAAALASLVTARAPASPPPMTRASTVRPLSEVAKEQILLALDRCAQDVPRAAAMLGVNPSTIYRKPQGWRSEARDR